MDSRGYQEVYFTYCNSCKHKEKKDYETPCDECLSNSTNLYSHRPVKWEAKDKK